MHRRTLTSHLLVVVLALLVVPAPSAQAQTSADVRRQLEDVTTRLQDAEARQAVVTDRLERLSRELARTHAAMAAARGRLGRTVRLAYMSGAGDATIQALISSPDPDESLERLELLSATTRADKDALRTVTALSRRQRQQRAEVEKVKRDVDAVRRRLSRDSATLERLFTVLSVQEAEAARLAAERAERARLQRIRERARRDAEARLAAAEAAARRRQRASRASAPFSTSGKFCPVGPAHSFADTWGAPRSGGRRHQGTDIFAPHGAPAYAVVSGRVRTGSNRLGGLVLYLMGDDGDEYYYAHNSANVARNGQRVAAGELIARVGKTGNAQGTSPHIHFERHPGGGAPVNPYPFLRSVCG